MYTNTIDRRSLSQQVVEKIKQAILAFSYKPGDKLIVDDLAEKYGVSKTPIREGLLELVPDGLVIYDGKSYFIPEYTPRDVKEILSIRKALESLSIKRATRLITDTALRKLQQIHDQEIEMDQKKVIDKVIALDIQFHSLIAEISGNFLLSLMLRKLKDQNTLIIRSLYETDRKQTDDFDKIKEHREILAALRIRSPEQAREAIHTHLSNAEARILKWFYKYKSMPQTYSSAGIKSAQENRSLSDQVAEQIKNQILNITLKPGQRLIVDKLAANLEMSRTPVREGLRKLTSEELVTYDGKLYRVRELTPGYIEEVFEIRLALETLAAGLAAKRINEEQLFKMRDILNEGKQLIIEKDEQYLEMYNIDIEFHEIIAVAAHNRRLKKLLDILRSQILFIRRWVFLPKKMNYTRRTVVEEHESVWEKLCQGDSQGASCMMEEHIQKGARRLVKRIRDIV